jgi:hypothetical protein
VGLSQALVQWQAELNLAFVQHCMCIYIYIYIYIYIVGTCMKAQIPFNITKHQKYFLTNM